MASSSYNPFDLDDQFDQKFNEAFGNVLNCYVPPTKEKKKRQYIERQREQGHNRLCNDYFSEDSTYPAFIFRRRFRMNKPLFMKIVDRLSNEVPYFQQRRDATERFGLCGLHKCTATIRIMAYGCVADIVDEYLQLGESTALLCLKNFVEGIISLFGDEYLRIPRSDDLQRLFHVGELRRFPGMIWSIDCALNDINVLDRSPVFNDILEDRAPLVNYFVDGREYNLTYYLMDGIYPKWITFIQSISIPQDPKATLFATYQESVRKDVERAFGDLQARFAIVRNPTLFFG